MPVAHGSDRKMVPKKTTSIRPQVGSGIIGAPPCQALVNGTGLRDFTQSPSIFVGGGYIGRLLARLHHEWCDVTFSYTIIQLGSVCRYARTARLAVMFPRLNASLPEAEVDTPRRGAMYLAQLAHKSEEFRVMEEIWGTTAQQASYEGRPDLGNTQPGDGRRFKGRGVIQITGRNNYRTAGEALGLPLLLHPELAAQPENAFRVAAWFWKTHGCNAPADKEDLDGCTGIVNGGLTGIESRLRYYELAKDVLGVDRLSVQARFFLHPPGTKRGV